MTVQRKSGRPPRYRNREEIETLIEQYFKDCEGRLLEDKEGNPFRIARRVEGAACDGQGILRKPDIIGIWKQMTK